MKFNIKLNSDGWTSFLRENFASHKCSVGWFSEKNTIHKNGASSSLIASIHITGSAVHKVPKRDFLKAVIERDRENVVDSFQNAVDNTKMTKGFIAPVLKYLGIYINDRVQRFLNNNGEGFLAPLSTITIRRKGHGRMLEATKKMKEDMQGKIGKL